MNLIAYIDGASLGNPGEAGFGVVVKDTSGVILHQRGGYIGQATNNVAEYRGLLACLETVRQFNVETLTIYSDSQLMVNQVNGIYRVKNPGLKDLHSQVLEALHASEYHFSIHHVPREQNKEADQMASRAARIRSDVIV